MKKTIATVVVLAAVAWWIFHDKETPNADQARVADSDVSVVDQIWISQVPVGEKEKVDVLAMLSEQRVGLFANTSAFEGDFALFMFGQRGDKVDLVMLQNDKKHRLTYKITSKGCGDEFEFCLKVKGAPRGAKTYGSRSEWRIEGEQSVREVKALVQSKVFQRE